MEDYSMWDEFLQTWPVNRVKEMTLEEYTKAGNKETFTYWLESKLDKYGSIWGGSSFKFGIYSRADTEEKDSNNKRSYTKQYGWYTKDGSTPEEAFIKTKNRILQVIDCVKSGSFSEIDGIELGPAYKWKIAFHYQDRSNPSTICIFLHPALAALCGEVKASSKKISKYHNQLIQGKPPSEDILTFSYRLWKQWISISADEIPEIMPGDSLPLNTIFYGPPGTGKTYYTINRALKIICRSDPKLNNEIGHLLDDPQADRDKLEYYFFKLIDEKRITFLTFHPSFTYEDFIHGIRPILGANENVSYEMKDGPFKKISEAAQTEFMERAGRYILPAEAKVYKMSLGNTLKAEDADIYDYCIEHGLIAHGFGNEIDFSGMLDNYEWKEAKELIKKELQRSGDIHDNLDFAARVIWYFIRELKEGDIVFISKGNFKIRAIGRIVGPYEFNENATMTYNQVRKVEWIIKNAEIPVEQILHKILSQQTLYWLNPDIIRTEQLKILLEEPVAVDNPRNYVLIIDEINRGNIPRIFGELITLIEEDKRLKPKGGNLVGYRVSLPGSGDDDPTFGVPINLYLIGTMNTADKSITSLDLALRRRFSFEPMYPAYSVIDDDELRELLKQINTNIMTLKDKDHQIGHSYFIGKDQTDLKDILNKKVLPLIEEYFFGDQTKVKEIFKDIQFPGGNLKVNDLGILRFEEDSD